MVEPLRLPPQGVSAHSEDQQPSALPILDFHLDRRHYQSSKFWYLCTSRLYPQEPRRHLTLGQTAAFPFLPAVADRIFLFFSRNHLIHEWCRPRDWECLDHRDTQISYSRHMNSRPFCRKFCPSQIPMFGHTLRLRLCSLAALCQENGQQANKDADSSRPRVVGFSLQIWILRDYEPLGLGSGRLEPRTGRIILRLGIAHSRTSVAISSLHLSMCWVFWKDPDAPRYQRHF